MDIIGNKDYNIYLGEVQFDFKDFLKKQRKNYSSIFLLTDSNVYKYCLPLLNDKTNILGDVSIIKIEAGEKSKSISTAIDIWQKMIDKNADRKSLLINFGGGVISDLGGFVAANFKRGIDFINIPTSLIGMADAAIGGKTAVDFKSFKNQIGIFANPKAIFIDSIFLNTLEKEHIVSGYAEIIKSSLLDDKAYWDIIKNEKIENISNWDNFLKLSITIKNEIIQEDFYETGVRKVLNFGHSIGHAFETYALERNLKLNHGHAVAIGLLTESFISNKILNLSDSELSEIKNAIDLNFEKFEISLDTIPTIIEIIKQDKKNSQGKFKFSLIEKIGKPVYDVEVRHSLVVDAIKYYLNSEK